MSLQPIHQTTFDDWLDAERARPDGRTEHVAGEVFAMAGGSEEHNLIVANVVGESPSICTCDKTTGPGTCRASMKWQQRSSCQPSMRGWPWPRSTTRSTPSSATLPDRH